MHWNVIPAYLGSDTKIRAWAPSDVAAAGPLLAELMSLLPTLDAVILGGGAAQRAWQDNQPPGLEVVSIDCPHPSPTNLNTRPHNRELVVRAWRAAATSVR